MGFWLVRLRLGLILLVSVNHVDNSLNSFTVTGDNNRLLQTAQIHNEPSHLDLRCLSFSFFNLTYKLLSNR